MPKKKRWDITKTNIMVCSMFQLDLNHHYLAVLINRHIMKIMYLCLFFIFWYAFQKKMVRIQV